MADDDFEKQFQEFERTRATDSAMSQYKTLKDAMVVGGFSETEALKVIALMFLIGRQ